MRCIPVKFPKRKGAAGPMGRGKMAVCPKCGELGERSAHPMTWKNGKTTRTYYHAVTTIYGPITLNRVEKACDVEEPLPT